MKLRNSILDRRFKLRKGHVRPDSNVAVLLADCVQRFDLRERQHRRRGKVALRDPNAHIGRALNDRASGVLGFEFNRVGDRRRREEVLNANGIARIRNQRVTLTQLRHRPAVDEER